MHSSLLLAVLAIALGLRWQWQPAPHRHWPQRWQQTLAIFCLPPLLLLSAALAVLQMGHHGRMLGLPVGQLGCWLALAILASGLSLLMVLSVQGLWAYRRLCRHPLIQLTTGDWARCLAIETPFAAQIGFWRSQLLVSQGLLAQLQPTELNAVIAHEQAHQHYRDPFWFFWLGWLRRLTGWLPNTEPLWQELLLLRELRADCYAAQQVEPLLLAELLVKLVALPLGPALGEAVGFSQPLSPSRLEQRVEALLSGADIDSARPQRFTVWWLLVLVPLATIWLHS